MNYIVVKQTKSAGVAILLTLLLGPIGLFYASVFGGLFMILTPVILTILIIAGFLKGSISLLLGSASILLFLSLFYWLICIIWAVISVNKYNNRILKYASQVNSYTQQNSTFHSFESLYTLPVEKIEDQSLQLNQGLSKVEEWMNNNPTKSINDYYRQFGNYF